jgi:hypothetical protein
MELIEGVPDSSPIPRIEKTFVWIETDEHLADGNGIAEIEITAFDKRHMSSPNCNWPKARLFFKRRESCVAAMLVGP